MPTFLPPSAASSEVVRTLNAQSEAQRLLEVSHKVLPFSFGLTRKLMQTISANALQSLNYMCCCRPSRRMWTLQQRKSVRPRLLLKRKKADYFRLKVQSCHQQISLEECGSNY